jgi:hypothetical protein
MSKTMKSPPGLLVPTVEEVPRISARERAALRRSLEAARADIAAGNYDLFSLETLRAEFDEVFEDDTPGEQAEAEPRPARKR